MPSTSRRPSPFTPTANIVGSYSPLRVSRLRETRLLEDAHAAQHLRDRRASLGLLQREGDLLFGEPVLLHGFAPLVRVSQNRKTRTQAGPKPLRGR